MSDDPSHNDEGSAGGDLELKPQWGAAEAAEEAAKPKPVAVRKAGDVAEAMRPAAADELYVEELAVESVKVSKEHKVGLVLLIVLLLAAGAAITYKILKVEIELKQIAADSNYRAGKLQVTATLRSTHDVQAKLDGFGDAKAIAPGESELKFDIEMDKLELGENDLKLVVERQGSRLKEYDLKGYRDFNLKIDKNEVANPPHNLYLRFDLPAGWSIRINKDDYGPDSKGRAKVKIPMDAVWAGLERFDDPNYRFDVPVKVTRGNEDKDQFLHLQKVDFLLPQARLELDIKEDALVIDDKALKVSGRTDPPPAVAGEGGKKKKKKKKKGKKDEPAAEAKPAAPRPVATIDGKEVEVGPDGRFEGTVKVAKAKKFSLNDVKDLSAAETAISSAVEEGEGTKIVVKVKLAGKVASLHEILVVRADEKTAKQFRKLAAAGKDK